MSEEAERLGLVNRIVENDSLLDEAISYAKMMKNSVSPASLSTTKRQIYTDLHRDVGASVRESESLLNEMMKQKDYTEAVSAFTQKRNPNWTGE